MKHRVLAVVLMCALLLFSSFPHSATADVNQGFCRDKCSSRCAKAGMMDRCLRYCGVCCMECKCVPSGTYGNKHECPCYRDKRSSQGKPKCP